MSAIDVNGGDDDADVITEAELLTRLCSGEGAGHGIKFEEVIGEGGHVQHAFGGNFDSLAEQSEAFDTGDEGFHFFTDAFGHESEQSDADEFSFGAFGAAFGCGAVFSELKQLFQ